MNGRRWIPLILLLLLAGGGGTWISLARRQREDGDAARTQDSRSVSRGRPSSADTPLRLPRTALPHAEPAAGTGTKDATGLAALPEPDVDPAEYGTEGGREVPLQPVVWKPGDTWRVETHYLQMQRSGKPVWTARPIVWEFTVRGVEQLDGVAVHALDVRPTDLTDLPYDPSGTLYVAADTQEIVALRDRILEQGRIRERFLRFDDPDHAAFSTLLPAELPAPGSSAIERSSVKGSPPGNLFDPDPKVDPPATSGRVLDVEFEACGMTLRQRWDAEDRRWPLYSRSPGKASYLRN